MPRKRRGHPDQISLPFGLAEAAKNERRTWLISALNHLGADAQVRTLLLAIHKIVDDAELIRERSRIAEDRDVGFSSPYVVMRAARRAEELGLLIVRENRYVHGGQRANGYRIDYSVAQEVATRRAHPSAARPSVRTPSHRGVCANPRTPAHTGARGGAPAHDPVRQRTPNKEYQSSCLPPEDSNHPPPPDAGACGWEAVEAELCKELTDWQTPIRNVRSRVTPDHVLRVLQHYRASGGLWGPGALHRRVSRAHPALAPEDGWPPPRPPSPDCRRALARLSAVRAHLASVGRQYDDEEFLRRFRAHLARCSLRPELAEECLARERLQEVARR